MGPDRRPHRSADDDAELLAAAFASRYHWSAVGGEEQRMVADWQIAHVASLLGLADLALPFSRAALARCEAAGWTDWRLASAHEGMARAYAVAGDAVGRARHIDFARSVLSTADGPEDVAVVAGQLATIPEVR